MLVQNSNGSSQFILALNKKTDHTKKEILKLKLRYSICTNFGNDNFYKKFSFLCGEGELLRKHGMHRISLFYPNAFNPKLPPIQM